MNLLAMRLIEEYKTLEEASEAAWFEANGGGWNALAFKKSAKELYAMLGDHIQTKEDFKPSPCWRMPGRKYP